ncbi:MAG TPA: hypothetical protein VI076_04940 [Actinopolymorphaceae bacterium]
MSAERSLTAEFPERLQAYTVLRAIGSGERTFSNIARAAGNLPSTSLRRSLDLLIHKRMVVAEAPLSTRPSRDHRYRITDPYLRFWLRFLQPSNARDRAWPRRPCRRADPAQLDDVATSPSSRWCANPS